MKNSSFLRSKKLFWANLALWIFFSFASILQNYSYQVNMGRKFNWLEFLSYLLPENFFSFLLSIPVYFLFLRTRRLKQSSFFKIHIPASLLFGILHIVLSMALNTLIRKQAGLYPEASYWEAFSEILMATYAFALSSVMTYWFVIVFLSALDFYQKYRKQYILSLELESRLTRSTLESLKMQLQPHFLFNALNTIAMQVRRNKNQEAVEMISGLSDLLRGTLNNNNEQLVSLKDELDLINKYLQIEQVRFKDKLQIQFDIQTESLSVQVPNLILQPIVENAFKYGISKRLHQAEISISTRLENEFLEICIYNTGSHLPKAWKLEKNTGIGLGNTLERLKQLYADKFKFSIENVNHSGVEVKIVIPIA